MLKETQWAQINAIGYNKCHVRTERTHTHTQKRQMYFFPKMIFNYSFFCFTNVPIGAPYIKQQEDWKCIIIIIIICITSSFLLIFRRRRGLMAKCGEGKKPCDHAMS